MCPFKNRTFTSPMPANCAKRAFEKLLTRALALLGKEFIVYSIRQSWSATAPDVEVVQVYEISEVLPRGWQRRQTKNEVLSFAVSQPRLCTSFNKEKKIWKMYHQRILWRE